MEQYRSNKAELWKAKWTDERAIIFKHWAILLGTLFASEFLLCCLPPSGQVSLIKSRFPFMLELHLMSVSVLNREAKHINRLS